MTLLKDPNSLATAGKDFNTGKVPGASLKRIYGEKINSIQGLERKVSNKGRSKVKCPRISE